MAHLQQAGTTLGWYHLIYKKGALSIWWILLYRPWGLGLVAV